MDAKHRDIPTQHEKPDPTTEAEFADYVVDFGSLDPSVLLAAQAQIGVSRFAFGPDELQDWRESQLSQNLSSSIRELLIKLRPHKLENLSLVHRGGIRRTVTTWILNQESISLLMRSVRLWPDDEGNRKLIWQFFRLSHVISYLSQDRSLVLLWATQHDATVFQNQGMRCRLTSTPTKGFIRHTLPEVYREAPPSGTWGSWDERDARTYFNHPPPRWSPEFLRIRRWWKASHDKILTRQVAKEQWNWSLDIQDIVANTPAKDIEDFKKQKDDPHVWYSVVTWFAEWRALELGLDKTVKIWPVWRKCAACGRLFHESSARVEMLGLHQIDVCTPCLKLGYNGSNSLSKDEVLEYLRALAGLVGQVPERDFGFQRQPGLMLEMDTPIRTAIVKLLGNRPSLRLVKRYFGSWFGALVASGVLADGARQGIYGTACLARDGHQCLSLAEKTIDDFLAAEGIVHEKEVPYPEGGYRADFAVQDTFIEYFGLQSRDDYALKTRRKIELCRSAGIRLIEIYPEDLTVTARLRKKLRAVLLKT